MITYARLPSLALIPPRAGLRFVAVTPRLVANIIPNKVALKVANNIPISLHFSSFN